uniref:DUF4268 domain-containing protein n=1 Tax=Fervidobacterium pennivorans TaxID=93466 RepID=A0A7V4KF77_FERPE
MNLQQGRYNLLQLLESAYKGEVMLPDFQRNFVWKREDIEELIKSLLEGMFIGTFLILDTSPNVIPFEPVFITGVKEVNPEVKANPHKLILDGQQRLTAMFYAIYCPNIPLKNTEAPYRFFINLEKLANDNVEDAVFSWSVKSYEYASYLDENGNLDISKLLEKKILPLSIFQRKNEYYKNVYVKLQSMFDDKKLSKIDKYIENMLGYDVLTLSLDFSYNQKPEEIAILFERINKTGIRLSTYDLLNARLYKYIKLREEWEKVFEENPNIRKLADRVDNTNVPYSFIQALALSKGMGIKSRELIKIDNSVLNKETWNKVVDVAENKLLPYLGQIDEFGIPDINKWLPYNPLVTLLTAFYLSLNHIDIEKIKAWYWSAVFTERYSGSSETSTMKDFREVNLWMKDEESLPEVVRDFLTQLSKDLFVLKNLTRSGGAKYRGVFNLIFMNKARDFYYPENLAFNDLEDHHIFPKAFLKEKNVEVEADTLMNRTLIFSETNRKISNKSPAEYIEEMIKKQMEIGLTRQQAEEKVKEILKAHFIDDEMYEILKSTTKNLSAEEIKRNFERFVSKREKLMIERIKEIISFEKYSKFLDNNPRKLNKLFWKSLLEKSNQKFNLFSTRSSTPDTFLSKRISKGLELVYYIFKNYGAIGTYIDFGKEHKELNKKVFDFFYKHRAEFEKVLGNDIEWKRNDKHRSCLIYKKIPDGGIYRTKTWDELQNKMVEHMFNLYQIVQKFLPQVQQLAEQYFEGKGNKISDD